MVRKRRKRPDGVLLLRLLMVFARARIPVSSFIFLGRALVCAFFFFLRCGRMG